MKFPIQWGRVPVPYTTLWSSEDETDFEVRLLKLDGVKRPFLCHTVDSPGVGRPHLGKSHTSRQVEVVRERLCQCCHQPLPRPAWAFTYGLQHDRKPVVTDGHPMCEPCALLALASCPALRARQASGMLRVWLTTGWSPMPSVLGIIEAQDPIAQKVNAVLAKNLHRHPFIHGGVRLRLEDFRLVPPAAIAAAMGAAQEAEDARRADLGTGGAGEGAVGGADLPTPGIAAGPVGAGAAGDGGGKSAVTESISDHTLW